MNFSEKQGPSGGSSKPVFNGLVYATWDLHDSDSECPVCRELYDDANHLPVFAVRCRHSVCQACLKQMPPTTTAGRTSAQRPRTPQHQQHQQHHQVHCPVCRVGTFHTGQDPNQLAITLLRKIKVMTMKNAASRRGRRVARCPRGMNGVIYKNPRSTWELRRTRWMGTTQDAEVEFFKNQLRAETKAHEEHLAEMTHFQEGRKADAVMVQTSLSNSMATLAAASTRMADIHGKLETYIVAYREIAATNLKLRKVVTARDSQISSLEKQLLKYLQESQEDRGLVVKTQTTLVGVLTFFSLFVFATMGGAMIAIRSYTIIDS